MQKKYTIDFLRKLAEEYMRCWSFAEVGKIFDLSRSIVTRLLIGHKDELNLRTKEEFLCDLQTSGKNYCFSCFTVKELNEFAFKNDIKKYKNICKDCNKIKQRIWRENNTEKVKEYGIQWRKNNPDRIREYNTLWRENNTEKVKEYGISQRKNNPDRIRETKLLWRKNNKDRVKETATLWIKNNPERNKKIKLRWKKNNPDKVREGERRRRANEIKVDECYTAEDEQITRDIFSNKCFKCGTTDNLTIDHNNCLSKNNALTVTNAVVLCQSCNSRKGTKDPSEFYTKEEMTNIDILFSMALRLKSNIW